MTDEKTRKWLAWAIVIMLIVISTVFGVKFPAIPEPPLEALDYTHFSGLVVTAPTTVATATPGAVINSLGLGNILEIQDASTPVFTVNNGGAVVGQVLKYDTAGQKMVCSSTNITGTGAIAHALATPSYVQLSLAQNVTGDCAHLSYTNSAAVVTAKCWNSALTPAAAAAVAIVNWCVIGTP